MATPDGEEILSALAAHDRRSDARVAEIADSVVQRMPPQNHPSQQTPTPETSKETHMQPTNIFTSAPNAGMEGALLAALAGGGNNHNNGMGAAMGGGMGAGLLGGILGGALLGGNGGGLFGNRNGTSNAEGLVTPTQLTAALNGVTENSNTTTILQTLGDIKASVPLAEAQVQLALAGNTASISSQLGAVENTITANQTAIQKSISDAVAASLASQNNININVLTQGSATREAVTAMGVANLNATKDSQYAIATALRDDGDKTRALLVNQNEANLQRLLAVAESNAAELRQHQRSRDVEVNVTQTVNQNQMQLQAQAQQQQQQILLNNLLMAVGGLQNATAANTQIIAGVGGNARGGAQTATPTNVNV